MPSHYSCVLENGRILVRDYNPEYDKPEAIVYYWPTRFGRHDLERFDGGPPYDASEIQVRRSGYYGYSLKFPGCGLWVEQPLQGNTKAVRVERVPIEKPKVKSGIEIRWRNYGWEKYLKSKGWVHV